MQSRAAFRRRSAEQAASRQLRRQEIGRFGPLRAQGNEALTETRQAVRMVIRTGLRAIVFPLALYAFSGAVTSYFIWHARNGDRGLKAKVGHIETIQTLQAQLEELRGEREALARKISQFQSSAVDRDLLDEEAHRLLGRADRREVVVNLP